MKPCMKHDAQSDNSLDPQNWSSLRRLGHAMIDDLFDDLEALRQRPVWRPMPDALRDGFRAKLPRAGETADAVYREFQATIAPYDSGNRHPHFMGWVQGGGTAIGMLAELLAGGLNENCGGRDHAGLEVERQVIRWSAEMLGLPEDTGGLLVTGSSMANFIALLCARRRILGAVSRQTGLGEAKLTGYAAAGVHRCVPGAFDMAGLGADALRRIPLGADYRMDTGALSAAVEADRAAGCQPFLLVGTVGSVDTGAIDDLEALAALAAREGLWFHADAAYGALAALSPTLKSLVKGIEFADSVAFDFHKWAQVQYDAGCILVRDRNAMLDSFAQSANYLTSTARGLAGGAPWPCDMGPDLSRGFRALKVWMSLKTFGADRLGQVADHSCGLARHLARLVDEAPQLQRAAPVALNIVCFRFDDGGDDLETLNADIVADLQEAGSFAPSTTIIDGKRVIRAAIVNHRTTQADISALAMAVIAAGQKRRNHT
jgi:aromatic-L-amino-acid decarboxylase